MLYYKVYYLRVNKYLMIVILILVTIIVPLIGFTIVNVSPSIAQQEAGSTFTSDGVIASTTISNGTEQYLVSGIWNLGVVNGDLTDLNVDMTNVRTNGSDRHIMGLTNFRADNTTEIVLTENGSTNITGIVDVTREGKLKWENVTAGISINQYNTIGIDFDKEQTKNHFGDGIRGITDSLIMGFESIRQLYQG